MHQFALRTGTPSSSFCFERSPLRYYVDVMQAEEDPLSLPYSLSNLSKNLPVFFPRHNPRICWCWRGRKL